MRVFVDFQDERLDLELPDERLVASWAGPVGRAGSEAAEAVRKALEEPIAFPPVHQMVVGGDRVAIALDGSLADVEPVLRPLVDDLRLAGVNPDDINVVATRGAAGSLATEIPKGIALEIHDPDDSSRIAYLAATRDGRRIYLPRTLTDADVVIPVGRLGFDPVSGYRGPWSVLHPFLGDQDSALAYRRGLAEDPADLAVPQSRLDEAFEVNWLLGTQFHMGVVPGINGPAEILAGLADAVRDHGVQAVNQLWSFRPPAAAECVVAGIGMPGREAGIEDIVDGLATASRLVNHGGKIVALSRARGDLGPSLQRLTGLSDMRTAAAALRGHDDDADSLTGRRLARVLAWADVYLLSGLNRHVVEDLSMIPVDHLDDARRLVARSGACALVSRANLTRATIRENPPSP